MKVFIVSISTFENIKSINQFVETFKNKVFDSFNDLYNLVDDYPVNVDILSLDELVDGINTARFSIDHKCIAQCYVANHPAFVENGR